MNAAARRPVRSRLAALAELVPPGSRVLDVGTDRALLPHYLLASGRASSCIASERDRVRLSRVPAASRAIAARLDLRAGDGLTVLRAAERVEVVVVAGLGARSICRILGQRDLAGIGVRRLVLQPQTSPALLRRSLEGWGFGIVDERLVEEQERFHTIVAAAPDLPPVEPIGTLTRDDVLEAGPCLLASGEPSVARYWWEELDRNRKILELQPTGRGGAEAARRAALATRILAALGALS